MDKKFSKQPIWDFHELLLIIEFYFSVAKWEQSSKKYETKLNKLINILNNRVNSGDENVFSNGHSKDEIKEKIKTIEYLSKGESVSSCTHKDISAYDFYKYQNAECKRCIDDLLKKYSKSKNVKEKKIDIVQNYNSQISVETILKSGFDMVDYKRPKSVLKKRPIAVIYGNEEKLHISKMLRTWSDIYVECCGILYNEYPYVFSAWAGKSLLGKKKVDISAGAAQKIKMISPRKVANTFYVETNYSDVDIIERIKKILGLCGVEETRLLLIIVDENLPYINMITQYEELRRLVSSEVVDYTKFGLDSSGQLNNAEKSLNKSDNQKLEKQAELKRELQEKLKKIEMQKSRIVVEDAKQGKADVKLSKDELTQKIEENEYKKQTREETSTKTEQQISLIERIEEYQIEYVDNREKGGCLWLSGGFSIMAKVAMLENEFGVSFHYSENGGKVAKRGNSWWTSDITVKEERNNIEKKQTAELTDSTAMQPPQWDKYEIAKLIELHFAIKDASYEIRQEKINELSIILKNYGKIRGYTISEKYRNVAGITLQEKVIADYLNEKKSKLHSPSVLMQEICLIYKTDYQAYEKLLQEANIKINGKEILQQNELSVQSATSVEIGINNLIIDNKEIQIIKYDIPGDLNNLIPFALAGNVKGKKYIKKTPMIWSQLYIEICGLLYDEFTAIMKALDGKSLLHDGKVDITTNVRLLKSPRRLKGELFVETNYSAVDLVKRIGELLSLCNVKKDDFMIFTTSRNATYTEKDKLYQRIKTDFSANGLNVWQSNYNDEVEKLFPKEDARVNQKDNYYINFSQGELQDYQNYLMKSGFNRNEIGRLRIRLEQVELYVKKNNINLKINTNNFREIVQYLLLDADFDKWANNLDEAVKISIKEYLKFKGINVISEPDEFLSNFCKGQDSSEIEKNEYYQILFEYFSDGIRYEKMIDRNRFRTYYYEKFNVELEDDDEQMIRQLKRVGIVREDRIFIKDETKQKDLIEEINDTIMKTFKEGASCIYLDCLFAKFQEQLAEMLHIYNVDSLESVLFSTGKRNYFKRYNYLFGYNKEPAPNRDVIEYMKKSHLPVTYSEIENGLWYIPLDKIKHTLVTTPGIVNVASEAYLYAPNLPVSESEVQQIEELISHVLLQRSYISDVELMQLIEEHCPSVLMNTPDYPMWGLRNALAYLLRDKFSFRGAIISDKDEEISMAEVFSDFCQRSEHITVDELKQFANELNTVIYWDSVYSEMVRINQNEFVRRDQIHFDIEQTDSVLDKLIQGVYAPIKTINLFLHFPATDVPWNNFVLESYVAHYSKKFRLLHASYTATDCCGAIVRQESEIHDYRMLIVDVLAKNTGWKNKKDALQLLVDLGYQQRRSYSDIEKVMQEAKTRMSTL